MVVSNTSWFVSQYSWIQPVSRCDRLSFWSVQMVQPGAMARFTSAMTTGRRPPAAQCSISCIRARPCAEVAVNVRVPAMEAPMQAAIAECSDSTLMYWAGRLPSATMSDSASTICVCGVMG